MDRNTLKIIVQFLLRKAISQKLSLVELKPLELLNSESVRTPCSIKKFDVRYKLAYQKKMKTMSIVEKSSEKTKIQRELFFYKFVAPVYNYIDLSAAVGSKNWNQKFPNFYGGIISDTKFEDNALLSDNGVLLLENLKESGFETIGKSKSEWKCISKYSNLPLQILMKNFIISELNLDYAKVAIKHLGQFHACGKALSKYQPSLHKYIQEHPHNYQEVVQILKQTPQNWHDDEIQVFFDKLIDSVYKVCVLNIKKNNSTSIEQNINLESIMAAGLSGPWITLLHGDYRKDNILFKKGKKMLNCV